MPNELFNIDWLILSVSLLNCNELKLQPKIKTNCTLDSFAYARERIYA